LSVLFFFFQAEDGIRDDLVTGVQTCALPISKREKALASSQKEWEARQATVGQELDRRESRARSEGSEAHRLLARSETKEKQLARSEERRVGKEARARGGGRRRERKEAEGM